MARRKASRSLLKVFWQLLAAGWSVDRAAGLCGVSTRQGYHWFSQAGGMSPLCLARPVSSRHLSFEDRLGIYCGLLLGHSYGEIGRCLGRATSTVTRELDKHRARGEHPRAVPRGRRAGTRGPVPTVVNYDPSKAQFEAEAALARPKVTKLMACPRLFAQVQKRLNKKHSPEQIMRRLVEDFPDDEQMRISHEAIYRGIYVLGRGGLKRELVRCLRTGRSIRKPRRVEGERTPRIKGGVSIAERPAEVEDRAVPGHWEGDLIVGTNSGSAIGTLVERTTRFTILLHLPGDHTAGTVADAMITALTQLPELMAKTVTWDQGSEMAGHIAISAATGMQVYFCDPASPWQRGTNENTNGLLRQYFPKGTDLSEHSPAYLQFVAAELNDRPRKTLGWKTPAEAFAQLGSTPPTTLVATTP
jgi:transposase, IS30 family